MRVILTCIMLVLMVSVAAADGVSSKLYISWEGDALTIVSCDWHIFRNISNSRFSVVAWGFGQPPNDDDDIDEVLERMTDWRVGVFNFIISVGAR